MKLSAFSALFILLGAAAAAPTAEASALRAKRELLQKNDLLNILDKKDENDKWSTTGSAGKRNILDKKDENDKWSTTGSAGKRNILDKKDAADKWSVGASAE